MGHLYALMKYQEHYCGKLFPWSLEDQVASVYGKWVSLWPTHEGEGEHILSTWAETWLKVIAYLCPFRLYWSFIWRRRQTALDCKEGLCGLPLIKQLEYVTTNAPDKAMRIRGVSDSTFFISHLPFLKCQRVEMELLADRAKALMIGTPKAWVIWCEMWCHLAIVALKNPPPVCASQSYTYTLTCIHAMTTATLCSHIFLLQLQVADTQLDKGQV